MVKPVRKSANKNPNYLSHEFVIQNHADIVSCVAMVFVVGLMFQISTPLASVFITLQHNATEAGEVPLYTPGIRDLASIFFYGLICVVIHAIIQEYGLDKISKKLHLSKSKLAVFSNSGQLSIFYAISSLWGLNILLNENYVDISRVWSDYPAPLTFLTKLYIIIQLAYSLHELPELYFQRVKREEVAEKAVNSVLGLVLVAVPYFLNFNRLLVVLLVLHHIAEFVFHVYQLVQTIDKDEKYTRVPKLTFSLLQLGARTLTTALSVFALLVGFANSENQYLDIQNGLFNTPVIRLALLSGIVFLQLYLLNNLRKELSKTAEGTTVAPAPKAKPQKKEKSKKNKKSASEESDLPEVDQNTNKNLRKQKIK